MANDKREIHDALVQGKPTHLDEHHKRFVGMVLKKENKVANVESPKGSQNDFQNDTKKERKK